MGNRKINIMTTGDDVIKITIKDGLFEDHIGLSYREIKNRFIDSRYYSAYKANLGSIRDTLESFMETVIQGECDPDDFNDLEYWMRFQI